MRDLRTGLGSGDGRSGPRSFACHAAAGPPRIWTALTDAEQTRRYLYGLAIRSTWEPDAAIDVRHSTGTRLTGRVLCCRPHERLSYLVHAAPDDPPVYLTWLIRPSGDGSTVRLQIDEIDCADSDEDAEDTWLPVLAALQQLVARG